MNTYKHKKLNEVYCIYTAKNAYSHSHAEKSCVGVQGDQATFEVLAQSFHYNQILGLDVCIRKPLLATCSIDRSVRIWNYETW